MRYRRIPDETVRRLPIYLRGLLLTSEQGRKSISSQKLTDFIGVNPKIIGRKIKNITIEDVSKLRTLKKRKIKHAIMAVLRPVAQETADKLVKAGVKGILNLSPCYISVPKKVKVITNDIAMDLACLLYYMPTS